MFGREMRIPLDVMMGSADTTDHSYTEFVADLHENLETAYRDVRQNLKVAQRRQKDAYDKGVKHTVYQAGDLVLRFSPELKPGEASKFHRQWEGPYKIVKQVTEVTYLVEKVGGRSRKSKVVHFNNLRLYERKSEGVSERAMTDAVRSSEGDDTEVVEGECEHEPQVQDSDVLEDSGYQSCYTDVLQPSLVERGAGGDPVVGMPAAEGDTGGDSVVDENVEGTDTIQPGGESEESLSGPADLSGEENGQSEPEYASQSQRPVRVRKPPDRYGEWVVNSLQQITDRLQMLEDQQAMEKERLRKLKPKLLKKGRALRAQ
ncbi:uncharacterized protein LOC144646225 [Oculina patagonica]